MLRAIFLIPTLIIVLPVVLVVVALLLVFRGSPDACGNGRLIENDAALAFAYDDRWVEFNSTLTSGLPASLTVSESEATSRAELFLATSSAPVEDVRVCFTDGGAAVNGILSTPFGGDVAVRIDGDADLSGQHPRADIESMRIGGLPGLVTRPFRGLVSRIVDDQMDQIVLDYRLRVELREGEAVIDGTP